MTALSSLLLVLALTGPTAALAAMVAGVRLTRRDCRRVERVREDAETTLWLEAIRSVR